MSRDRELLIGTSAAVIAASLFAMLGPLSRFASEVGVGAIAFVAWRAIAGTAALGVGIAARREAGAALRAVRALHGRGRLALLVAATMGLTLNLAIFVAFSRIPIALALMLFYTYPAMVVAVDLLTGRERPSVPTLGALALASIGVVLVLVEDLDPASASSLDLVGILLAFSTAVSQTIFVSISRRSYGSVPANAATFVILGVSVVGASTAAVLAGQADDLLAPLRDLDPWPYILLAGVLAAGVSSFLFLSAIRLIGGTRTGILMLLEPVGGTMLAGLLLGEGIGPIRILGGGLVLAGAVVLQLRATPHHEPLVEEAAGPIV
jgi:drug/metabolite transporter (DMT)-like permease